MTRNCTACHGSRVGNEYLGRNEGLMADVHFREGRMSCDDCHDAAQMHGGSPNCDTCHVAPETSSAVPPPDHRYSGFQQPGCEACHAPAASGEDGIEMHTAHAGDLSCQVCHSVAYGNCDGCHVAISESSGRPYYSTRAFYLGFYIGRNPQPGYARPYSYVPVRHVPIDRDSFVYYGENLLVQFDSLPTWVYATPHNIQRVTPQTESCNACHGNPDLFLTADQVSAEERSANRGVIVPSIPALVPTEEAAAP
jgi:thiosulfate/3-mercaptopyruvate sulfurtransferase